MILHVLSAEVIGPHQLRLRFNDGTEKAVDAFPLLRGPIFEPLLSPEFFARVSVDPLAGTVVWPNGTDLAPEALRGLPEIAHSSHREHAA